MCDCADFNPPAPSVDDPCNPVMMDGRAFTDYRGKCAWVTGESSYEMRQRLMRDADALISQDRAQVMQNAFCAPCFEYSQNGTMLPAQNVQQCNERTCSITTSDPAGLGLTRAAQTPLQGSKLPSVQEGGVPLFPIGGGGEDRFADAFSTLLIAAPQSTTLH